MLYACNMDLFNCVLSGSCYNHTNMPTLCVIIWIMMENLIMLLNLVIHLYIYSELVDK
jgi:hypothetical protein